MLVAVLALGTRGDVQPLLALSIALKDGLGEGCSMTLVTHAAHQGWLKEPAGEAGLQLSFVSSLPARRWDVADAASAAQQAAAPDEQERQREELVAACEAALGRQLTLPAAAASQAAAMGAGPEPAAGAVGTPAAPKLPPAAGPAAPNRALLIFNLFALEGFHLAEALGVPCLAASPCLVPYAPPTGFERRFQHAHPQLYRRLQAAGEGEVGWAEVRHWCWPLFTERWGPWRYHRLGLPAVPYSNCTASQRLPPPVPLLIGISESVCPRPGHFPPSVHLTGYWHSGGCFSAAERRALPAEVLQALPGAAEGAAAAAAAAEAAAGRSTISGLICVDFGSMGAMGLLPRPQLLAAVLASAGQRLRRHMLVLTAGWQPLADACRLHRLARANGAGDSCSSSNSSSSSRQACVLALEQPVPHDLLLPHCSAILHHGGAGTVAAALRCGTPQLVCPLIFDQQQWAERVAWLGCAMQLSPAALLQQGCAESSDEAAAAATHAGEVAGPSLVTHLQQRQQQGVEEAAAALAGTFAELLQDGGIRQQCARMQQQLAGEDGLAAAVGLVRQHLETRQAQQQQAEAQQEVQQQQAQQQVPPPALEVATPEQELELPGGLLGRPLRVRCGSPAEALFIGREILQDDCYLAGGVSLPPGSVVVDAGANIGLFALRLLLDPATAAAVERVHAFEPLPPTARLLQANLEAHGVDGKVTIHRCGLHSSPGALPFTFYPAMPGNSTADPAEKWAWQRPRMAQRMGLAATDACFAGAASVACPVTTLARFVREQQLRRIDLLKVDVEGCELEVLAGMDAAAWAATRQVAAEVHDVAGRLHAVKALLEQHGYAVHCVEAGLPGTSVVFAWQL